MCSSTVIVRITTPAMHLPSHRVGRDADDPLGTIKVTTEGIGEIGKRISALDLPTVIVMEGGYNNEALGRNIISFLGEFR